MDTKVVANLLGTETRVLRRFLRDKKSTFKAVGSGSRYDFTETDVPELQRRFQDWMGNKQPLRTTPSAPVVMTPADAAKAQLEKDMAVWAEEATNGVPIVLEDLRKPRVLAKVRATARAQEARLNERLLAAGLHLAQARYRDAA